MKPLLGWWEKGNAVCQLILLMVQKSCYITSWGKGSWNPMILPFFRHPNGGGPWDSWTINSMVKHPKKIVVFSFTIGATNGRSSWYFFGKSSVERWRHQVRRVCFPPKLSTFWTPKKLRALEGDISFSRLPGVYFSVSIFGGIPKIRWARLECFFCSFASKQWRDHFGEKSTCQISWECKHLRFYVKQLVGVKSRTVHSLEV